MEQLNIQNKLAYMDALSRANEAGYKASNELAEVIQLLRADLGIEDFTKKNEEEVKRLAKTTAQVMTQKYIRKLQEDGVLTFKQAETANEEIWNIK